MVQYLNRNQLMFTMAVDNFNKQQLIKKGQYGIYLKITIFCLFVCLRLNAEYQAYKSLRCVLVSTLNSSS